MSRFLGSPSPHYTGTPLTVVVTLAILSFFFIGFLSLYFCKCIMQNFVCSWHHRNVANNGPQITAAAAPSTNPGLDPKIIQSFPTFLYSSVKDYRKEKYGLECAICLIEFENDDVLRLLTSCCHVFHQDCIDLWLEFHNTCPVCRRGLDSDAAVAVGDNSSTQDIINHEDSALENSFVISIKDDENREDSAGRDERDDSTGSSDHQRNKSTIKFSRSHSTGHSIVRNRGQGQEEEEEEEEEGEDKFTLRLPEHVKAKIIKGHNPTKSCITFGEYNNKNGRTVEKDGGFVETAASHGGDINRV